MVKEKKDRAVRMFCLTCEEKTLFDHEARTTAGKRWYCRKCGHEGGFDDDP